MSLTRACLNPRYHFASLNPCPYEKVRPSFFSYTYRHLALTVNLPLLTIPLGQVRILIWKIVVMRMTSEVVENTGESSFGEGQANLQKSLIFLRFCRRSKRAAPYSFAKASTS